MKNKELSFADKAKEIMKRYKIKDTSDVNKLPQIERESFTMEMNSLREKQELARQAEQESQQMAPGTYAYGGGVKKYDGLSSGSTVTKTNMDEEVPVKVQMRGYTTAGTYEPYEATIMMPRRQAEDYIRRQKEYEEDMDWIRRSNVDGKIPTNLQNKDTQARIARARENQEFFGKYARELNPNVTYGSQGTLESTRKSNDPYDVGDFTNNTYFGDRSRVFGVNFAYDTNKGKSSEDDMANYEKNPEYAAEMKKLQNMQTVSRIAETLPVYMSHMNKVNEKPIAYTPQRAGYVNYQNSREQAKADAEIAAANTSRALRESGATRGQLAQGLIQSRLGLNRQVGDAINKSYEAEANQNAQIYNQVEGVNTGLRNRAIDANYQDSRYAEEMNDLLRRQRGKIATDMISQMIGDREKFNLIGAYGNSSPSGTPKYIRKETPVINSAPVATSSSAQTAMAQNNQLYPIQSAQAQSGFNMNYNPNLPNGQFYGSNSLPAYMQGDQAVFKFRNGGTLIGKISVKRK